jgi:hypothetical protein
MPEGLPPRARDVQASIINKLIMFPVAGHEPTAATLTFRPRISIHLNKADNAVIYLVLLYVTGFRRRISRTPKQC